MLGRFMAWYYERFIYKIPKKDDPALFVDHLVDGQCHYVLGMLKYLFYSPDRADCKVVACFIDGIAEIIYQSPCRLEDIKCVKMNAGFAELTKSSREDFYFLSLIVTLSTSYQLESRIKSFLVVDSFYCHDSNVKIIMNDLLLGSYSNIKSKKILGEGYQNKIARLHGMRLLGLVKYRQEMACMQKNIPLPRLAQEFEFLYDLPDMSLGKQFVNMMESSNLPVVGQAGGFASFFLWHDLTHLIAGCSTTYTGELNANAFTAGSSVKCRRRIIIFGLLQFNLGVQLAVVATAATNQFSSQRRVNNYLQALLNGSHSTLDVCRWDLAKLKSDLKKDIMEVRKEYNIIPL
jgi:hypothetical protein